jgi:hypothetical protein
MLAQGLRVSSGNFAMFAATIGEDQAAARIGNPHSVRVRLQRKARKCVGRYMGNRRCRTVLSATDSQIPACLCHQPKRAPRAWGVLRPAGNSGCLRVFDFHPMIGSTRAIPRSEALRHDTLAAESAGVLEDDRPVASVVLVEGDAFMGVSGARRRRRRRHPVRCRQDAVYFHLIS